MIIDDWQRQAQQQLTQSGIETARLDILVLMEDALGIDRAQLLAHPETELPANIQNLLNKQTARRVKQEPLAYIRGKTEFYGRDFIVSSAVLEPRPESETMIDMLKELLADAALMETLGSLVSKADHTNQPPVVSNTNQVAWRLADVGTGSGALGITAALELPNLEVELLEIDTTAVDIAKCNVVKHTTGILVTRSDLLDAVTRPPEILLCNLPYVPDEYSVNAAATFEPRLALFAGSDGLDLYRRLFEQIVNLAFQPLLILCESFPFQHGDLRELAEKSGYQQLAEDDFIQAFILQNTV